MRRLFAFAFCAVLSCSLRAESFDLSGFSKLVEIRSSADSVAPGVVLTDFQVLVRLSADIEGFSYSDFRQDNGVDLAFLDGDKNLLAHEIDTWNTEGESLVWVKIPAFQRGTKIYMVYGSHFLITQTKYLCNIFSAQAQFFLIFHCHTPPLILSLNNYTDTIFPLQRVSSADSEQSIPVMHSDICLQNGSLPEGALNSAVFPESPSASYPDSLPLVR